MRKWTNKILCLDSKLNEKVNKWKKIFIVNQFEILHIKETFSGFYILDNLYQIVFCACQSTFALLRKIGNLILSISCESKKTAFIVLINIFFDLKSDVQIILGSRFIDFFLNRFVLSTAFFLSIDKYNNVGCIFWMSAKLFCKSDRRMNNILFHFLIRIYWISILSEF